MRLTGKLLWAWVIVLTFSSLAAAAEGGAVAASNARSQAQSQAAANLGGGGGPGVDLRAIANPNRQPTTFTGFPAGTLPGDRGSSSNVNTEAGQNAVMYGSGDRLAPIIGPQLKGATLSRVHTIAAHVGYTFVLRSYSPNVMDAPYTVDVMSGRSRKARLYIDQKMVIVAVVN